MTICILVLGLWMPKAKAQVPGVIIDQDMSSDHDDVADLSALNALAVTGKCKLLACMADADNGATALCMNSIDTYWGNSTVPCGALAGVGGLGNYPAQIAQEYPHPLYATASQVPTAAALYRQILAAQPNNSVVIVTTGFLTNLQALLLTGSDQYSSLTGPQLVAQKVKLLACAGGQYPSGGEFNFAVVPAAAQYVVNNWPAPATYVGFEFGGPMGTCGDIGSATRANPMRRVWEIFTTLEAGWGVYSSWGQCADTVGVRGAEGMWSLYNNGRNNCYANGVDYWDSATPPAPEAYVIETERYPLIQSINALLNLVPPTQPSPSPGQPTNVRATVVSGNQINLQWDNNAYNAAGFQVERRNNSTGAYSVLARLSGSNVTTYSDTTVTSDTNIGYRVMAYNGNGNSKYGYVYVYSGWTEYNLSNPGVLPLYNYYQSSNLDWILGNPPYTHAAINNDSTHGQNLTINTEVGTQGNGGSWYIYFFYQDPNDWYRLNVTGASSAFEKDIGGTISEIATSGSGASIITLQYWQINVTPGHLQFSANGTQVLNATDSFNYTSGKVGVGGYGNAAVYQNFYFDTSGNVVSGLNATAGVNQVNLSWNALSGATSYNVYRSVGEGDVQIESTPIATGITGTSFTDTTANGGDAITYYYQVAAVTSSGTCGFSNETSALPNGPPPPPMGVSATNDYGSVDVTWDPFVDTTLPGGTPTFNVYRGTTPGGESGTPIATGVTNSYYIDGAVTSGSTYYYKVSSINSYGTSGFWGEATNSTSTPPAPTGLSATGGNGQVSLNWTASAGTTANGAAAVTTSYNIYRGTSSGGEGSTPIAMGISLTSYTDVGAANGATYYYVVQAVNVNGSSGNSTETSATPGSGGNPPSNPAGLTATAGSGQVGLSWTAGSGAGYYDVYRGTSSGGESNTPIASGIASTSYTDSSVSGSTAYYYKVQAVNGSGASSNSNEASATPASGTPSAPAGLTATAGNSSVGLRWTASSGASSYNVYRGTYSGGENSAPIATSVISASYTDTSVTNGITYYYDVKAVNSYGLSVSSSEANTTPTSGAPLAPGSLTATAGNGQVGLSWDVSNGATSYNVYRGTSSDGESSTPFASGITSASYTDSSVIPGTTYYYQLQAVNSDGSSGESNEAYATPASANGAPLAPTGLTATGSNGQVSLSWTASSGATSYNVYRGTSSGGESATPIATGVTSASYTDSSVTDGTTYYYEVAAVNSDGSSVYSNEASATPTSSSGSPDTFANASFETPSVGGSYEYNPPGSSWTWTNNAGIQSNGSAYGAANAPNGTQTALIQGAGGTLGTMSQVVDFTAGTYTISFYGAQRAGYGGDQPIRVSVDSTVVGTYLPPSTSFTLVTTATFTVTAGNYTVTFAATNASADNTVFLDEMSIASVGSAPATPTGLAAVSGSAVGQIALSWTASAGAQDYILHRSTTPASGYSTIATIAAPAVAYTDSSSSLVAGQNYYYEVAAANTSGTSAFSADAGATPYVPASFNGWVYTYFGLNAPSSETADTADPANDGLSNLIKYALGLNPLVSATFQPVLSQSGATWQFTYQRPANRADLTYAVQVSSNLSSWTSTGVTLSETASGNPQTWQATYTPSLGSKFFFRLQVTGP